MPAPEYDIRDFRIEDLDAVRRLWADTEGLGHGPGDSTESMRRFLDRNAGLSLVAFDGTSMAASVLCGHDGRRGIIYRLAVAREHRRRGLGAELVKRCLAGLKAEGIERCFALVEVENAGGLAFWEGAGWRARPDLVLYSTDPS
jgi:ribosomal protein S18 acetylase RimI-like enzyme